MTPQEQAAQDAANAAKYNTPLPPNDPASVSGARNSPLYIGPTNFSTIQKQYTPYQIEQATTRDSSGNIFWKQGVNISDIPASAPLKAPETVAPLPATAPTTTTPAVTAPPSVGPADYQARNVAAGQYLTGIAKTIDDLNATRESLINAQKEAEQKKVDSLSNRLLGLSTSTARADKLQADRDLFKVTEQIQNLATIQSRIADAQSALNQGLIFEEGRPVRMSLLTGRSAELQKQGLAQIQSLQTTAEIVKGNIEMARAYASDSQAALSADINDQRDALNTLLDLHNKNLVDLKDEEKAIIKDRMASLSKQQDDLKANKDQIFDLAVKYPSAFTKGGVTFLDDPQTALQKMLPTMSAQEQEQYNLDLQTKQAALAKAKKTGSGGSGGGSGENSSTIQSIASSIQSLRDLGYNEGEIRSAIYQEYGGSMKTTELNSIVDNIFQGGMKPETLSGQNDAYIQDRLNKGEITRVLDEKGNVTYKPNPDYKAPGQVQQEQFLKEEKSKAKSIWNPFTWTW